MFHINVVELGGAIKEIAKEQLMLLHLKESEFKQYHA